MGSVFNRGSRSEPNYYGKFRDVDGTWRMKPTGQPSKDQARDWLRAVEARIARGLVGVPEPSVEDVARERLTVGDLVETFVTTYSSPKLKSVDKYRTEVGGLLRKHVLPTLGALAVRDLAEDPERLEALRDAMLEKLSRSTVRSVLIYVSRMFGWARKRRLIDCDNPVARIDKPTVGDQPFDYLSRDEVGRLLEWAAEHQPSEAPYYATACYCGLRRGELAGLRWGDVDLDRGLLTVQRSYRGRTKSGKARHVPINPRLTPILRAWRRQWEALRADPKGWRETTAAAREDLTFPSERGAMRADKHNGTDVEDAGSLPAALEGAKCHAVTLHSLRHSFASHFVMAGGSILALQRLMGHASVTTTMRYAHLAPNFMQAEIARMSFEPAAVAGVSNLAEHRAAVEASAVPA